jgi:uncharacterized membrane protein YphA (DoxX/SURF4 family)
MAQRRKSSVASALRFLLVIVFLLKGLPKVMGTADAIADFERFRYPDWFRVVVGVVEMVAAVMLLRLQTTVAATTALAAIMIGAIVSLINAGEYRESLVPMVFLAMLAFLGWQHRPR